MINEVKHKAFTTSFDETTEGLVKAYVSVYGNVDSANEICDWGCFKDSLEYKYPVFCLYHNWEKPIGKVIIAEEIPAGDDRLPQNLKEFGGLYIEAQINLDKEIGRDAWSDIKQGVLDEYSIGYVVQEDFIDKEGYRHLTKVDLIEASPVVRAANRMTKTVEVKSELFTVETIIDEIRNKIDNNPQINTKQMKELLDQIQEYLTAVMQPLDDLRVMMAEQGLLEDTMGDYNNEEEDDKDTSEVIEDTPEEEEELVEAKALDLEQVLGLLSEIISLSENAMAFEMQWEDKSIDDITEQIIGLISVVQSEIENPSGNVDLQAMVDAFAVVNANVTELIAEAEAMENAPENVSDYIATMQNIGDIAMQLTEIVMAEMETQTSDSQVDDQSKAVDQSIDLKEQIELEQLFNHYLQSQFNIK